MAEDPSVAPRAGERIVICGINYAPEVVGVGRYTGEIGTHFAALGHSVCVVSTPPHYPGWKTEAPYANRWSRETIAGAEVYRCPLFLDPDMRGFKRLLAPLSFALAAAPVTLWQVLKRRPAVVIAVEPALFSAPAALLAARLTGAKAVLHVQDLEVDAAFAVGHLNSNGLLARLGAWFDRTMVRSFDRVITISGRMAEKIVEKGVRPDRIAIVRNWVDTSRIQALSRPSAYRAELGMAQSTFVVLYAGTLALKQGVGLLVRTAELLADDPNIQFVVAGDGPMRPEVEAAAAALPNLRHLPFQPEERFSEFLGLADLHVLPQERSAADLLLPSKLGGMLASGRRIVVTADSDTELAEFLGESCTFVPPGDATALAAAIRELSRAPADAKATAQRLSLAGSLSKAHLIDRFTEAALFAAPASTPSPILNAAYGQAE